MMTWDPPAAAAAQEEAGDTLATATAQAGDKLTTAQATDKLAYERRVPLLTQQVKATKQAAVAKVRQQIDRQNRAGGRAAAKYKPHYEYKWQDYCANQKQRGYTGPSISCAGYLIWLEGYEAEQAVECLLVEWEAKGGSFARAAEIVRGIVVYL